MRPTSLCLATAHAHHRNCREPHISVNVTTVTVLYAPLTILPGISKRIAGLGDEGKLLRR